MQGQSEGTDSFVQPADEELIRGGKLSLTATGEKEVLINLREEL